MDNPSDEAIAEALRLRGLDENMAPIFKTLRSEQSGVLHHARTIDQCNLLVEALEFYADENNPNPNEGPWGSGSNDFGDKARQALGQFRSGQ